MYPRLLGVKDKAVSLAARDIALDVVDVDEPDEMIKLYFYYTKNKKHQTDATGGKGKGKGGRMMRNLIAKWFHRHDIISLVNLRSRSFTVKDLIKLAHVKPKDKGDRDAKMLLGPIYTWRRICRQSVDGSLSEGFFFAGEVFRRDFVDEEFLI